jgi:glutamate-1-semialdehyde 2,1-aminomutase
MKSFEQSKALFARASEVIPAGIYGHASPATMVPGAFPYFAKSAQGCRYQDVDGNEYIDYMCGFGPILLGYQHPEICEAAREAELLGDCFNHPTEYSVRLAEQMVAQIERADWAVFGKNGSDMTNWAIRVAREQTGRKRIAKETHAYHGIDPWCVPGFGGVIAEDRSLIDQFYWNDVDSLEKLLAEKAQELAAIVVTPFHHPNYADSALPTTQWIRALNQLTRQHGIILILDDVRCGLRLHLNGSHCRYGLEPDLMCYSKAIGNGYPISACVGTSAFKVAASKCFLTGSFWNAAVPMAAAMKTLEIAEREAIPKQLEQRGKQLTEGMIALGQRYGIPLLASGEAAMPYVRIAEDPSFKMQQRLCAAAIQEGLFLHPHHNWFLSAAHTKSVIDESLQRFEMALKKLQDEKMTIRSGVLR